VAGACDEEGEAETTELVQPYGEVASVGSPLSYAATEGRVQRRWSQTLLRSAQWKDKRQQR